MTGKPTGHRIVGIRYQVMRTAVVESDVDGAGLGGRMGGRIQRLGRKEKLSGRVEYNRRGICQGKMSMWGE
ncbi:hypothetical protein E2C01_064416 [Portunus trituberculatus]|uniref:Uncharacterized protein n=1 Tax=Portunus trituberculatus TaxID=210409 RepID=A0A5B7HKS2_PORTR|nr:hypothetical protein [Portunus trituberculatus]